MSSFALILDGGTVRNRPSRTPVTQVSQSPSKPAPATIASSSRNTDHLITVKTISMLIDILSVTRPT